MSDIQEEQKRLYKRAEENDLKATMKPLFSEDVEMVCISKNDYDRLYGNLTYENIELQNRLNNIIDELEKYLNEDDWTSVNGVIAVNLIKNKLNELKGDNKYEK